MGEETDPDAPLDSPKGPVEGDQGGQESTRTGRMVPGVEEGPSNRFQGLDDARHDEEEGFPVWIDVEVVAQKFFWSS